MRVLPKSLAGQLSSLLLATLVLTQLLTGAVFILMTGERVDTMGELGMIRYIGSMYRRIENLSSVEIEKTLELASSSEISFSITHKPLATSAIEPGRLKEWFTAELEGVNVNRAVVNHFPISIWSFWFSDDWQNCYLNEGQPVINDRCLYQIFSLQINEHRWLNIREDNEPSSFVLVLPILASTFAAALGIAIVVLVVVRYIIRPISDLSKAAEKLGRGENISRLEAAGPRELASLTKTFNIMQNRISRFVQDRTRMLAAVSHDLRTPITSLRLRAEFIKDKELKAQMIDTLEDMQIMVEAALAFAKQEALTEEVEDIDLVATLTSLAQENKHVEFASNTEKHIYPCRTVSFKRAIRNLVDNAVKYGKSASVSLISTEEKTLILIRDQGPGIPENKHEEIFEPFVRLDEARNTEHGSVGLGLSIARTIIHKHGGSISLKNTEPGLEVQVSLPRNSPE